MKLGTITSKGPDHALPKAIRNAMGLDSGGFGV